jgi:hypothetical protein
MYENGQGVAKDNSVAYLFWSKAANEGSSWACMRLGQIALYGQLGYTRDPYNAALWLRIAAQKGLSDANGLLEVARGQLDYAERAKFKELEDNEARIQAEQLARWEAEKQRAERERVVAQAREQAEMEADHEREATEQQPSGGLFGAILNGIANQRPTQPVYRVPPKPQTAPTTPTTNKPSECPVCPAGQTCGCR